MSSDKYVNEVEMSGDRISDRLAEVFDRTLEHSRLDLTIQDKGMGGLKGLRIPSGYYVAVHSLGADPSQRNLRRYASSLVHRLADSAEEIGFTPVGFTNVIASQKADGQFENYIIEAADSMSKILIARRIPCINGEYAVLGHIITGILNSTGTMISLVPKTDLLGEVPCVFSRNGITYAVFDPGLDILVANSDGEGTKSQFNILAGRPSLGVYNAAAMNLDDTMKSGARARVLTMVAETNIYNWKDKEAFVAVLESLGRRMDFTGILQQEDVGKRIRGDREGPTYNLDGSSVATITQEYFDNPPVPKEGQDLLAVQRKPINARSNGFTWKRDAAPLVLGKDWEKTSTGRAFLEYLCAPSTILYESFMAARRVDPGCSVYHMSGGAFKGKFAKPLAKQGLYAKIGASSDGRLFTPDYRELALLGAGLTNAEDAHRKSSMNNDGFIGTTKPDEIKSLLESRGFEVRRVGKIERRKDGVVGLDLVAFNGANVSFTWKK